MAEDGDDNFVDLSHMADSQDESRDIAQDESRDIVIKQEHRDGADEEAEDDEEEDEEEAGRPPPDYDPLGSFPSQGDDPLRDDPIEEDEFPMAQEDPESDDSLFGKAGPGLLTQELERGRESVREIAAGVRARMHANKEAEPADDPDPTQLVHPRPRTPSPPAPRQLKRQPAVIAGGPAPQLCPAVVDLDTRRELPCPIAAFS